jgi:hypothetical protein
MIEKGTTIIFGRTYDALPQSRAVKVSMQT